MSRLAGSLLGTIAALIAAAAGVSPAQDATAEVLEELYPSGAPRVRTEARREGERLVPHGAHRRWHENGQLAVEGGYQDGLLDGPWQAWYPDGSLQARGQFREGRRAETWELYHPGGQLAAKGAYLLGCRDRRWVYFDAAGVKDEQESGLYRAEREAHENRARKSLGETLDKVRHGAWTTWWAHGEVRSSGAYARGRRQGWWEFRRVDGSLEPGPPTGWYEDGRLVASEPPPAPADPFVFPEELVRAPEPQPDPARAPLASRPPGSTLAERDRARAWIDELALDDGALRAKAAHELVQCGRGAVAEVLRKLVELDLERPDEQALAERLHESVLCPIARGRGEAWPLGEGPEVSRGRRQAVVRWLTWWELVREDDRWWTTPASAVTLDGLPLLTVELYDGAPPAGEGASGAAQASAAATRKSRLFEQRRRAAPPIEVRRSVDRALDWLVRHQSLDGRWSAAGFAQRCAPALGNHCDGPGADIHDVGVSGLALLAFLADGHSPAEGRHSDVVARAVEWLVGAQDRESGLLGAMAGHGFVYDHAIATLALAEAAQVTADERLDRALEAAVRLIRSARNPNAGWRYEIPPNGESDTSITAWMVSALVAADAAGLALDLGDRAGAIAWLERMTDPESGRIGYYERGSQSSRIDRVNDRYPRELTETLTAAGLHALWLLGESPAQRPAMDAGLELLSAHPPQWSPDGLSNDVGYWFHGAAVMHQVGGKAERAWRVALERALLGAQHERGDRAGSWDPDGPWGAIGGRVHATALGALALQSAWRELPAEKQR